MSIEIKVPEVGESITEGVIAEWRVAPGVPFSNGAVLLELETDKVTQEIYAPAAGKLVKIEAQAGETVQVNQVIALMEEGEFQGDSTSPPAEAKRSENTPPAESSTATPAADAKNATPPHPASPNLVIPPGARRLAESSGIDPTQLSGSGIRGQVTKSDVIHHLAASETSATPHSQPGPPEQSTPGAAPQSPGEREIKKPMSRLRQRIAERLIEAQQTAAILTTFNEVDLQAVSDLRKRYKDSFKAKYGVNLGYISFFTRAAIEALKLFPALNSSIEGTNIIYKNYYDIGVAVGGPRGLVVPIIRDADRLSFAGIEQEIVRLAEKVKNGSIELSELSGGTFTISNGGVYGSLLSTPILNPPQSGILGMHNIVKRPVVINDEIVIRPMMYLALSYDHRIVDGREAVSFLLRIKECIEDPERILLDI